MSIFLIILGLLLFVGLVVVHEFGHLMAARRNGVEVEEFGIGIPPRAWGKKAKNGILISLNWLPIGGFVKLKGEHDADDRPGSFGAASSLAKAKIMLAGVAMNLVVAFGLFTLLAAVGIPRLIDNQFTVKSDTRVIKSQVLVGYVEPGSPAEKAGIKTRDHIINVVEPYIDTYCGNGVESCSTNLKSSDDLIKATHSLAGKLVEVSYTRNGHTSSTELHLRTTEEVEASKKTDNPKGYLGIAPTEYVLQRSTWSAPVVGAGIMWQFTDITFRTLGTIITSLAHGNASHAADRITGPVGIVEVLKDGSLLGFQFVLMLVAVISLSLGIWNVLPIPALDGGRLFVMLLFRAIHKPLAKRTEELIHGTGFAVLLLLIALITVVDIRRFF